MKKFIIILCVVFLGNSTDAQQKIYFKDKTIASLNLNIGSMYRNEESGTSRNFPDIWRDFDPDDGELFSGYYTLDPKSDNDNKILNGEIKLITLQIQVAEGTMNIKEELTFNFVNGNMSGPTSYFWYRSNNNGETNEAELINVKWKKEIAITANYDQNGDRYKNINYLRIDDWDRTKYTISQAVGSSISLYYFGTIIDINTALPTEKPIFKKIKY